MNKAIIKVFQDGAPLLLYLFRRKELEMTIHKASEKYNIPIKILREYESWGLCGEVKKVMGSWRYDDSDIERLSMIMTLHDVGFTNDEVEEYMKLLLQGKSTEKERLKMLNDKRYGTLDEIHFKEKQLDRLDYLRFEIQREDQSPIK